MREVIQQRIVAQLVGFLHPDQEDEVSCGREEEDLISEGVGRYPDGEYVGVSGEEDHEVNLESAVRKLLHGFGLVNLGDDDEEAQKVEVVCYQLQDVHRL